MFTIKIVVFLFIFIKLRCCAGEFVIPDVTLEAYKPKGFKASIPDVAGIQMFAFHGRVNQEITQVDAGEFGSDTTSPSKNVWSYINEDLTLKVGDRVNYWIFVQHDRLGYRKDNQTWVVPELLNPQDAQCEISTSVISGRSVICKNKVILEDNFDGTAINTNTWLIEEFIPFNSPDYEFVTYQNKPDVCYVYENKLFIKPKPAQDLNEVHGELDLRNKCTRQAEDECKFIQDSVFIIPPVTSARLVSVLQFRYVKVEIKAKFPAGDWMYPQMYLEHVSQPEHKIWIGYARGNNQLIGNNNNDIGSRLLFGGPVLKAREPDRSTYLKSKRNNNPFTSQMHLYTLIWAKDRITLLVDGEQYGDINAATMRKIHFAEDDMVRLVLGVGVGGVNDFPDGFKSGNVEKPWRNYYRDQSKNFFMARNQWKQTWLGDNAAFQIESVKISSL